MKKDVKIIVIILILFLLIGTCERLFAQEIFTAKNCSFSYLENGKWSDWSNIKSDMKISLFNSGTILIVNNEFQDKYTLVDLSDKIVGIDTTDQVEFTAWVWYAKDRDGAGVKVILYEYSNNKRAYQFVHKRYQYLFSDK
jgi:hypothetical protein